MAKAHPLGFADRISNDAVYCDYSLAVYRAKCESQNVITLDGVKGIDDPNKRSIEEIVINEMNMDTVRSAKYNEW